MKDNQRNTSIANYLATVEDIDELMGICIGLLGESQSMSPEDRTIAGNLLGDASALAADAGTNEHARLLRITEAAIGGVALGDNETIAALFQRHKTELERLRRKAASAGDGATSGEEAARATSTGPEVAAAPEHVAATADPPAEAPAARTRKRAPGRKKSVK